MNTTTTPSIIDQPPAHRQSAWDLPASWSERKVASWVTEQYALGYQAGKANPEHALSAGAACSDVYALAYNVGRLTTIDPEYIAPELHTVEACLADAVDQRTRRAAAAAEAESLITHSARSSMQPEGLDHYSSAELDEAMAVWEGYGLWSREPGESWFTCNTARTVQADADALASSDQRLQPGQAYQLIKNRLFAYTQDTNLVIGSTYGKAGSGKVAIDFVRRGEREFAPPGTPQLYFVAMPTSTKAYRERNEAVWVVEYIAPTFTDRETGEVREAWYEPGQRTASAETGVMRVVRTFPTYEAGVDARIELVQARRTITRELASQHRDDIGLAESKKPEYVRPVVELL